MYHASSRFVFRGRLAHLWNGSEQTVVRKAVKVSTQKFRWPQEFKRVDFANLLPPTEPSFLPLGSSSSTPHHSPAAKSVDPMNLRVPTLEPWLLFIMTRSPILKSTWWVWFEARLVFEAVRETGDFNRLLVLPVGDRGLLLTPLFGDGEEQMYVSVEPMSGRSKGTLVRRVNREKTPLLGSHWK